MLEAPSAINWEAALSVPTNQPAAMVKALGFDPGARQTQSVGTFRNISAWSLWPGATVLVVGGLLALAFQWRTLARTFSGVFTGLGKRKDAARGVLDHVEVPMLWFVAGFVVTGSVAAALLVWLFEIHWYMGLLAVLLTFFLAAVAARAGAETGINPITALGKVTQLTYGAIAPGNIPANLMTACVTAGAACSCCDTIGNLKVGHLVGASPRRQLISQLFGVLAGALLAVPAYFVLVPDVNALGGEKFPAPSALVWMGVAKVLSQGLHTLPRSAVTAMMIAIVAGIVIVVIDRLFPKAKPYTPSPTALGLAFIIPGSTSFAMFLGALIVWVLEKKAAKWNDFYTIPIASGGIAGESLMGVILAVLTALGLRS
jgi:OPT family oligopeptide transporter